MNTMGIINHEGHEEHEGKKKGKEMSEQQCEFLGTLRELRELRGKKQYEGNGWIDNHEANKKINISRRMR